ncbi:MAG: GAF domain-containing protein [Desulfobacterales bacterium]|nr:MAG: GAF domain-containing protein [Desulfobacterales bacterium]UCD90198.1 MAG: GAF domain-containing protein [Desulfobacterales bacterium]
MAIHDMMNLDTFKFILRSIAESENLETMGNRSTQLLVGSLGIKASAIFALNPETEEIETLASFGLSIDYLNKGPIKITKSKGWTSEKEPIVINDITKTDLLQYPEQTKNEGVMAMISIPIIFFGRVIGLLRLYHHEIWEVSKDDLDAFSVLAEIIGMTMMYSRILNALQTVKDSVNQVHSIWLEPKSR